MQTVVAAWRNRLMEWDRTALTLILFLILYWGLFNCIRMDAPPQRVGHLYLDSTKDSLCVLYRQWVAHL